MINEFASDTPILTLVLRTEEDRNLFYVVELEGSSINTFYRGENFNQAIYVANNIFKWLKENEQKFAIYKEERNGTGASYFLSSDLRSFPCESISDEDFLTTVCEEFESKKIENAQDINGWFRSLVNKYKLNEYQEFIFLKQLKEREYL